MNLIFAIMSDPKSIAAYLLAYYIDTRDYRINPVTLSLSESDNQYVLEILVQMYVECHRLFIDGELGDVTFARYLECLNRVFISIGYTIKTSTLLRGDQSQIVPAYRIIDKTAHIVPFHPLMIREMIVSRMGQGSSNPELESIYNDGARLSEIIVTHDMDQDSDTILTIRFIRSE